MNKLVYDIIRTKYENGLNTIEELADAYRLDYEFVLRLVNNIEIPDDDFEESSYDSRVGKCGKCGSEYNEDGYPITCMGDCEHVDSEYFVADREDGDPEELNFE